MTRVGKRNQVTIPAAMLRALDATPGTYIEVAMQEGGIHLTKAVDPVDRSYGLLRRPGAPPLSIVELEQAIQESHRERAERAYQRDLATKSRG